VPGWRHGPQPTTNPPATLLEVGLQTLVGVVGAVDSSTLTMHDCGRTSLETMPGEQQSSLCAWMLLNMIASVAQSVELHTDVKLHLLGTTKVLRRM